MVTIASLWLPILLSSVLVFIASFIVWAVLPFHRSDFGALPNEAAARDALTPQNIPPGQYNIPNLPSRSDLKNPDYTKKFEEGPVGFLTVLPNGIPPMGRSLVLSFIYYLVIGAMVAYLASRMLDVTTGYLTVFRMTGTLAWLGYGFGVVPDAIWFGRPWSAVFKHLVDALIYALLTAGAFAGFWPN
jgi:hypothetical protein